MSKETPVQLIIIEKPLPIAVYNYAAVAAILYDDGTFDIWEGTPRYSNVDRKKLHERIDATLDMLAARHVKETVELDQDERAQLRHILESYRNRPFQAVKPEEVTALAEKFKD